MGSQQALKELGCSLPQRSPGLCETVLLLHCRAGVPSLEFQKVIPCPPLGKLIAQIREPGNVFIYLAFGDKDAISHRDLTYA